MQAPAEARVRDHLGIHVDVELGKGVVVLQRPHLRVVGQGELVGERLRHLVRATDRDGDRQVAVEHVHRVELVELVEAVGLEADVVVGKGRNLAQRRRGGESR